MLSEKVARARPDLGRTCTWGPALDNDLAHARAFIVHSRCILRLNLRRCEFFERPRPVHLPDFTTLNGAGLR